MGKLIDLSGNKYGLLTVVDWTGDRYWNCVCDCGNKCLARGNALKNGLRKSCGCVNDGWNKVPETEQEFIDKSIKRHGTRYGYDNLGYINSQSKVNILCYEHGYFQQTASNHSCCQGCPECGKMSSAETRKDSLGEFIEKANAEHGDDRYSYKKSVYKGSKIKLLIGCNVCLNDFYMSPNSHLVGQGCRVCANKELSEKYRSNTLGFINKAKALGTSDLFGYDKVDYINNHTKVVIGCKVCGQEFEQKPNHHLSGRGCPHCATSGFKSREPAYLYVLECGRITKIGITNGNPKYRASHVSKSYGSEFKVVTEFKFEIGSQCHMVELHLLKQLRGAYLQPQEIFHGYTECFYDVDVNNLLADIPKIIKELMNE